MTKSQKGFNPALWVFGYVLYRFIDKYLFSEFNFDFDLIVTGLSISVLFIALPFFNYIRTYRLNPKENEDVWKKNFDFLYSLPFALILMTIGYFMRGFGRQNSDGQHFLLWQIIIANVAMWFWFVLFQRKYKIEPKEFSESVLT